MSKVIKNILKVLIILVLVIYGAFLAYTSDYYEMSEEATTYLLTSENVDVEVSGDIYIFKGDEVKAAFIFYPGGKVDYRAYAPLLSKLAANGYMCLMPKMPGNLAVLKQDAATSIKAMYPEIDTWYLGGHSLGGATAALYLEKHVSEYDGLILLAAYSTKDLSRSNLNVISIYGSEDHVLKMNKYQENKKNLPNNFSELVISGGNHAQFGMYGVQDGDGQATISNEDQINITVNYILDRLES